MEKLMEKFNALTDNAFAFLRLNAASVNVRKETCDFTFLYPAHCEKQVLENRERIESMLKKAIGSTVTVNIRLKRSHFDFAFFKAEFCAFLNKFPTLAYTLTDADLSCEQEDDAPVLVLRVAESLADYIKTQKIQEAIDDFLYISFCENVKCRIEFTSRTIEAPVPQPKVSAFELDRPQEGRLIRPQNVEEFIGRIIYEPAGYIEDAVPPKDGAVYSGTLSKIYEQTCKPREGETEPRKFYKFSIEDFTGQLPCVYFPNKKTIEQFGLLIPGKQIVVRGKLEEDTYRGNGAKSMFVRDISLCTLPSDFKPNRIRRRVPEAYKTVFPKPHVKESQASLFDTEEKAPVPGFLLGKTICVFDIETTGFNPDNDKIIEIGAVKAVDGKVTETFSTFIDPLEPIPERIVKLTHIEDNDVAGAPRIEDVLPDFYKFVDGAILVGQNVQFDHGFIYAKGSPLHMYFENKLLDTLSLAKTYVPNLRNYKLDTIAKAFGIVNKGAHRAVNDAWATWEVFYKLAEKLPANA